MNQAFNDFLSSIGGGLSGDGGPNMKSYQHASKLYVEGGYARAPKFNHLYFVSFNISDGVVRDRSWLQNGYNTVGLLVKSTSLPKFKIAAEQLNQYNRKTQVQTRLTYEPVTMEFHDDNSEITNGLWKNYYRYYYTDSIYGGKDDTVTPTPSQVSLGKKLFGGLLSPGRKRIKQRENNVFPDAYTDNKYRKGAPYAYGLDNFQTVPFFKSIDIFVLHQQKFTQITLINPKITSWDHDDVGQSDSTKMMRNKMSLVYENVLYNDGRIGKGSRSGVFAEAFYDTSPSPLSIAGKGSASLFGPGGLIGGIEDVFGENGALAQGDYLAAALQAATLIKNAGQISEQQLSAEGYSMLGAAVGIAVSSRNGEISQNLQNYFGNAIGVYTNQYSKNNLEDIPAAPVEIDPEAIIREQGEVRRAEKEAEKAQQLADERARAAQDELRQFDQTQSAKAATLASMQATVDYNEKGIAENNAIASRVEETKALYSSLIVSEVNLRSYEYLRTTTSYNAALAAGYSDSDAIIKANADITATNALAKAVVDQANKSLADIETNKNQMAYASSVAKAEISTVNAYYNGLVSKTDAEATILKARADLATQTAAYGDALNNGKIATSYESQIALDAKVSALTGIKILENSDLTAEQVKLRSQASAAFNQYTLSDNAATALSNGYANAVKLDNANGGSTKETDEFLLTYAQVRLGSNQILTSREAFIDKYGQDQGIKAYDEFKSNAISIFSEDLNNASIKRDESLAEYSAAARSVTFNAIKISENNTIISASIEYGTSITAGKKLLESELAYNKNPNKPYIIMTDSRTLEQLRADSTSGQPVTETVTVVSKSQSYLSSDAINKLQIKLAEKIYGPNAEAVIPLNGGSVVKQTETVDNKGNKVYTYTLTGSTTPPAPILATSVIVQFVDKDGKVKESSFIYGKYNDYLTQSQAAAAQLAYYNSKNLKVLGMVVNTQNLNNNSSNVRYSSTKK
jgi:hypothetical protein